MKKCRWCVIYIKPENWEVYFDIIILKVGDLTHEDICELRQVDCVNKKMGCKVKPQVVKLPQHQKECKFR